jgi:hypothetical protein
LPFRPGGDSVPETRELSRTAAANQGARPGWSIVRPEPSRAGRRRTSELREAVRLATAPGVALRLAGPSARLAD